MSMGSRIRVFFLLCILLGSVAVWTSEAIDCRRYVFAPRCRGISAKRANQPPFQFRDFHVSNRLAPSSHHSEEDLSEEQDDYDSQKMSDETLRFLMRKYWNRAMINDNAEV